MRKFTQILGLVIIGSILITEFYLRIFYHENLKTQSYPLIYQPDSMIGYSLIPCCNSRICIPSIDKKFKLNNHGYYGRDFIGSKPDSIFRVAVVGNSISEGIWLNAKDNYPIILQKMLYEKGIKNIEVINCSIGGVNKDIRNYKLIQNYVTDYHPNLILFHIGAPFYNENEIRENYKDYILRYSGTTRARHYAMERVDQVKSMKFFTNLYDLSYIFRAYCKYFYENNICSFANDIRIYREKTSSSPDIITYQYSYNTSMKLLSDLKQEMDSQGCKLVVFAMDKDSLYTKELKNEGIPNLTLNIRWNKKMFLMHDSHLNGYGHKVIAEQLFNWVIKSDYLSKTNK